MLSLLKTEMIPFSLGYVKYWLASEIFEIGTMGD